MATISYKCDTCKRETELIENQSGFTTIGKCNITEGCLGHLYKIGRNPNNVRESSPQFVEGLSNFIPRRAMFTYPQTLPSNSWEVTHNMGVLPATFVYVRDANNKLSYLKDEEYSVIPEGKNKIVVNFDQRYIGVIQCVARSTVPQIPNTLPAPETTFQVSAKGIMTIAVPKYITYTSGPNIGQTLNVCTPTNSIKIDIEISKPNEESFVCTETVPNNLDSRSPWNAWNEIIVAKRKNYCVRSIDILKMKVFGTAILTAEDIPNGTRMRFLSVDYGDGVTRKINTRSVLALLSKSPYQYVDKIQDQIVDIGEMAGSTPDYFVYIDGELRIDNTLVEKTYPDIGRQTTITYPSPTPTPSASGTPPYTPSPTPTSQATLTPTPTPSSTPAIACGSPAAITGSGVPFPGYNRYDQYLGPEPGYVVIGFATGQNPDKLQVWLGNQLLYDTGYWGSPARQAALNEALIANGFPPETINPTSGTTTTAYEWFNFYKDTGYNNVEVRVYSPLAASGFGFIFYCPSPTPPLTPTATASRTPPVTPSHTPSSTPAVDYNTGLSSYFIIEPEDSNYDDISYAATDFNDSSWLKGYGGFGSQVPSNAQAINTFIGGRTDRRIWIRQKVTFPQNGSNLRLDIWRDDGAQVWFNGQKLPTFQTPDYYSIYAIVPSSMITGDDMIALRVTDGRNDADLPGFGSPNIYASLSVMYTTEPPFSPTPTPSITPSNTATPPVTPSPTPSISFTPTVSLSSSITPTPTPSPTQSPSATETIDYFPKVMSGAYTPEQSASFINAYAEVNGIKYASIQTANAVSRIATLDENYSNPVTVTEIPVQNQPGSVDRYAYTGLFSPDDTRLFITKSDTTTHNIIASFDPDSRILTGLVSVVGSYSSPQIGFVDGRLIAGRTIGSSAGDGWVFCDYPNGGNQAEVNTNYLTSHSGAGNPLIVPFGGAYYATGNNTSVLTKMSSLTAPITVSPVEVGFGLNTSSGVVPSIASFGTGLVTAIAKNDTSLTDTEKYSVFDGTTWTAKTLPSGYGFAIPLNDRVYINSQVWTLVKDSSKNLHVAVLDVNSLTFVIKASLPPTNTLVSGLTDSYRLNVSQRFGNQWTIYGIGLFGSTERGIIINLTL